MSAPKKPILTPAEAIIHATIRPREAPRVRPQVGITGWLDWHLIDRRGRAVDGGQCPNLWLDQGLDAIATIAGSGGMFHDASSVPFRGATHLAVGSGSDAVDPTQTSLVNEIGRTSTLFGTPTRTRISNGVYRFTKAWQFDYGAANGSIREWAICGAGSAQERTRALVLDDEDNPITIPKTSDFQLRGAYTCEITLGPTSLTPGSIEVTGLGDGVLNGNYALITDSPSGWGDLAMFSAIAQGYLGNGTTGGIGARAGVRLGTSTDWSYTSSPSGAQGLTPAATSYSSGTHQRSLNVEWGTGNNQAGVRSIFVDPGLQFIIGSEDGFTKDNEHRLIIDNLLTVAWDRAA